MNFSEDRRLSMKLTGLVDNAVQPSTGFWGEHGLPT
jgi:hypothetical protein